VTGATIGRQLPRRATGSCASAIPSQERRLSGRPSGPRAARAGGRRADSRRGRRAGCSRVPQSWPCRWSLLLVGDVAARLALVPVAAVLAVQMAVVRVVDVVAVGYRGMAAVRAVGVGVGGVLQVKGGHDAHLRKCGCGWMTSDRLPRKRHISGHPARVAPGFRASVHEHRRAHRQGHRAQHRRGGVRGARAGGSPPAARVRIRRWATARKPSQSAQHRAQTRSPRPAHRRAARLSRRVRRQRCSTASYAARRAGSARAAGPGHGSWAGAGHPAPSGSTTTTIATATIATPMLSSAGKRDTADPRPGASPARSAPSG